LDCQVVADRQHKKGSILAFKASISDGIGVIKMEQFSFVLTLFFMLLGPIKLLPAFAAATAGSDESFKRSVAIRAFLVASLVLAVLVLSGKELLSEYQISLDGVRLAGGLVLLMSALRVIFPDAAPKQAGAGNATPMEVAVSPVAFYMIVPPAGVAAVLAFVMIAPEMPGLLRAIVLALTIIMILNWLAMHFHSKIMKIPGLMMALQVAGSVLVFVQAALGLETMLHALRSLGVIP